MKKKSLERRRSRVAKKNLSDGHQDVHVVSPTKQGLLDALPDSMKYTDEDGLEQFVAASHSHAIHPYGAHMTNKVVLYKTGERKGKVRIKAKFDTQFHAEVRATPEVIAQIDPSVISTEARAEDGKQRWA